MTWELGEGWRGLCPAPLGLDVSAVVVAGQRGCGRLGWPWHVSVVDAAWELRRGGHPGCVTFLMWGGGLRYPILPGGTWAILCWSKQEPTPVWIPLARCSAWELETTMLLVTLALRWLRLRPEGVFLPTSLPPSLSQEAFTATLHFLAGALMVHQLAGPDFR